MNTLFILTSFLLTVFTVSQYEDLLIPAELDNPSGMIILCQASIFDTLNNLKFEYENGNLIKEISIHNGEVHSEKTFTYNSGNQITSEVFLTDRTKSEKNFVYNDNAQLINIIYKSTDYDVFGQIANESVSEAPREYENNQLVKDWELWGGFHTYEYNGDKVVKKIDYTKYGKEHCITTYEYAGDLLIEEKKETKTGDLIYSKTYKYDNQNRLLQIREGENIIEENEYIDNKLIEKRKYYFGMDPGYYLCSGNYIYRYEY